MWTLLLRTAVPLLVARSFSIAVEHLFDGGLLIVCEVGSDHRGDWITADYPVPHLLPGSEFEQFDRLFDLDIAKPCSSETLTEHLGIGHLEIKRWRIAGYPREARHHGLQCSDEYS